MQMSATKLRTSVFAIGLLFNSAANAADVYGAWANAPDACSKVFAKKGDTISMTKESDRFGSGFIIDKNRIRGKMATCFIKSRKDDAGVVQLITSCSTDVALSTVQFTLKLDGDDRLIRLFSGMPGLEMSYVRCPF